MDAFEWATLFLYLMAWSIPTLIGLYTSAMSSFSGGKSMRDRYKDFKTFLPKIVPSWAFGPIWSILYIFIGLSSWMYLNWSDTELHDDYQGYYDSVHALLLGNYVLNVSWTSIFFGFSLYWLGTIMGFFIFASALTIAILMWIHSGLSAITVIGAILFIPYVIYSGYAFILALDISINYYGVRRENNKEEEEKEKNEESLTFDSTGRDEILDGIDVTQGISEKNRARQTFRMNGGGGGRRQMRRPPPTAHPQRGRVTRIYEYV
jgi:tryptophan-rich sensory protein